MRILAGVSVFEVGRHTVGMGLYSDDANPSEIVSIRVSLDGEVVNVCSGSWHEDEYDAMEQAALRCLADSGHTLRLLDS
ncbi:hypothetical protein [Methylobacterium sp. J-077]|uniref:hypothetical protein n=1 Tax=Methylobacterium sp. J-077 TaxID=2836656 RepID=UPI001FB98F34|nr:hypothetical protein [Methylobacterium sp. J-077]MCJ2121484.1 hypothetical protein [Methylobacterium sp. J-077]